MTTLFLYTKSKTKSPTKRNISKAWKDEEIYIKRISDRMKMQMGLIDSYLLLTGGEVFQEIKREWSYWLLKRRRQSD